MCCPSSYNYSLYLGLEPQCPWPQILDLYGAYFAPDPADAGEANGENAVLSPQHLHFSHRSDQDFSCVLPVGSNIKSDTSPWAQDLSVGCGF